jgi:hypothetical protein
MTLGASTPQGPQNNAWLVKPALALTAAGTNQSTAYVIPSGQDGSIFTTVASGTGAQLPSGGVGIGEEYVIANHGSNALLVYPPLGGKMGTASTNAGYSLTAGKTGYFLYVGSLQWTVNP